MANRLQLLAEKNNFQIAIGVILFVVFLGIVAPFFTKPTLEPTGSRYEDPSMEHKLGTTNSGMDIWARLMEGIRNSLLVGFLAGSCGLLIAFVIGGVGGYKGGIIDETLNVFSNVFMSIPIIPILIVLAALFEQRSLFLVMFIIGLISWPGPARTIRSQVLSLKQRNFVDLARVSGKSDFSILFTEVFPNMLAYIFITFVNAIGGAILAESGISLIGLGPTRVITLGGMLHRAIVSQAHIIGIWNWYIPPGIILVVLTGTMILLGSIIDDVLNPRLRGT